MGQQNNFDLIRLIASVQVAVVHALTHFGLHETAFVSILNFVPGVPIFFFVSGLLISASYARSSSLGSYARKRALRIFPALWAATAVALLSIYVTGYFSTVKVSPTVFAIWVAGQATFIQFFNPDFMRGYGTGVLNGSLWTITVELQFYVLMPVAALLLSWSRAAFAVVLALLLAASAIYTGYYLPRYQDTFLGKLSYVTFLPWIGMFLLGVVAQVNWLRVRPFVEGRFGIWLLIYCALIPAGMFIQSASGVQISGNRLTIVLFVPLAMLVLSAAYTAPTLSEQLLSGNDVSYRLYIYHIPVINFWLYTALPKTWLGVLACVAAALTLALASWFLVERPALRLKSGRKAPRRAEGVV